MKIEFTNWHLYKRVPLTLLAGILFLFSGNSIKAQAHNSEVILAKDTSTNVAILVFSLGSISKRCQGDGQVNYTAYASNNSKIIYSLDEASLEEGNTINSMNGSVNYTETWNGISIITATASEKNEIIRVNHTVINLPAVGEPVFIAGATSTRKMGAGVETYTATAINTTGITYSLDAANVLAGNTINQVTGEVNYVSDWKGATTITASAAGCGGPKTAKHTVITSSSGTTPIFTLGTVSKRVETTGINPDAATINKTDLVKKDTTGRTITFMVNTPGTQYEIIGGLTAPVQKNNNASGNIYKITQLPYKAVLYYKNTAVGLNQVIRSLDPSLLKIDPDDDTKTTSFSFVPGDEIGEFDSKPASVTVLWNRLQPVNLINFSGKLINSKVELNWVTANEYFTRHFELERSKDAINFVQLAAVPAKGNNHSVTSYDMPDTKPLNGLNYYRLKIVDTDGSIEYSDIIIVRIENNVQQVTRVAPNPFTGKVDIYLSLTHKSIVDFRFIDMDGKMVMSKQVKGFKGFNWFAMDGLEKLPAATYILHIVTDDMTIVEKLVKQ